MNCALELAESPGFTHLSSGEQRIAILYLANFSQAGFAVAARPSHVYFSSIPSIPLLIFFVCFSNT